MKVRIKEVEKTLLAIVKIHGIPTKEANILIAQYLEGELMGKKSHGLAAFPALATKLNIKRKSPVTLKETSTSIYIDAKLNFGLVVGINAAEKLFKKARKNGMASAFIKNMSTWLRPGTIAKFIAEKDMIGIVINTGGVPMVAPPGGFEPVIGTNPIAFGIPTNSEPLVSDMATSIRAWGEVREAARLKQYIPDESYFDNQGNFTTHPEKAYSARAMGDYKGFAIGLFIEIMAGAFTGMAIGQQNATGDYRTLPRGGIIIVFDPEFTVGKEVFLNSVKKLMTDIKKSKPRSGNSISLPGEKSSSVMKQNIKKGYLEVDDTLWNEIKNLK